MVKNNEPVHSRFKNIAQKKRKSITREGMVKLTNTSIGCAIKATIGCIGDKLSGGPDVALYREFPNRGAQYHELINRIPGVVQFYDEHSAVLTPYKVYHRYHKMYYENKSSRELRGAQSKEHWMIDPRLTPYITLAQELAYKYPLKGVHPMPWEVFLSRVDGIVREIERKKREIEVADGIAKDMLLI